MAKRIWAILWRIWRAMAVTAWFGLGLWAVLAVFFTWPGPVWLASALAAAFAGLFVGGFRERYRIRDWRKLPWRQKRLSTLALAATAAFAIYYFGFVSPDPNLEWVPEQARMPIVTFEGNKVRVRNVRNFTWHSATEFTPGFYDRVYDVDKLESMYYIVAPMPLWEGVAHVLVSFGFSDGNSVAVSVEGRRVKGIPYRIVPSMFRQYQLIYVVGDERDVVGLRGAIWKKPVHFYPANTTKERKQAIFVDMMRRAHELDEHPEFYHLIANNCMNNITYHLRRLGGRPLPHDLQVLLTGLSDRVAHRLGYIDTDLPFEKARQAFRIDKWIQQTELDEGFSVRLRETLRIQEARANEEIILSP